jgi:hypothetical protein
LLHIGPLEKVFFATHLPWRAVPGEIAERLSFKSFLSKISVRSVAVLANYARGLLLIKAD